MSVVLTNLRSRLRAFVLAHEAYCAARGTCACALVRGRRIPSSLTLAAGVSAGGLDEAVLAVPEIARAVRAGEIRAGPPRA
jgi:hypothetical protein